MKHLRKFNENENMIDESFHLDGGLEITIDIPKDHYETICSFILTEKDEVDNEEVKHIYKEYINYLLGVNTHDMSDQFEVWIENNFDDFIYTKIKEQHMKHILLFENFTSIDRTREEVIELLSQSSDFDIEDLESMSDNELEDLWNSQEMDEWLDELEREDNNLKKINMDQL